MADHDLLILVDVLRTIVDKDVSIEDLKLIFEKSAPHLTQVLAICEQEISSNSNRALTIDQRKEQIQCKIKQHYKQVQDFSFILKIHQTIENGHKLDPNRSISISPIPKTLIQAIITTTDDDNDGIDDDTTPHGQTKMKRFYFSENGLSIESTMTKMFQYLNFKHLSCCRAVCQQWLYYASNPLSVYHVDTFYIRKLVDHFLDWKYGNQLNCEQSGTKLYRLYGDGTNCVCTTSKYSKNVARYNINLIKDCQSLTIDTEHWGNPHYELDCYLAILVNLPVLRKVMRLEILSSGSCNFEFWLSRWIEINRNKRLKSVKMVFTWKGFESVVWDVLTALSIKKNGINLVNTKQLEIWATESTYNGWDIIMGGFNRMDLSQVESLKLKLKPIANDAIYVADADEQSTILVTHTMSIWRPTEENERMKMVKYYRRRANYDEMNKRYFKIYNGDSLSELKGNIIKWDGLIAKNGKGTMKVDGINIGIKVGVGKAKIWQNLDLDLSKSEKLIEVMKLLYKWYQTGNVSANTWFCVEHKIEKYTLTRQIHDELTKHKWIQLIVKALQTCSGITNDQDSFYKLLFDNYNLLRNNPNCVPLVDRIIVKLFVEKRKQSGYDMVATTICVTIEAL